MCHTTALAAERGIAVPDEREVDTLYLVDGD